MDDGTSPHAPPRDAADDGPGHAPFGAGSDAAASPPRPASDAGGGAAEDAPASNEAPPEPARKRPRGFIRQYELVDRVRSYDPRADEDLLNRAYVFAMRAHGGQSRLSGDPYFSHPLEVAGILTDLRADPATIVTALLHDTIEDTGATRAEIGELFGEEVAQLVDGVTKLTRMELKSDGSEKAENFRKLLLAMSKDVRVLLVKLADRLHNMRTLDHHPKPEKRRRIALETMEIFAPLAGRIGVHRFREELEDLAFAHLNGAARVSITRRLEYLRADAGDAMEQSARKLEAALNEGGVPASVRTREKRPYSIWRKMQAKDVSFEQLSDIFALRVIVATVPDCYKALGVIHDAWACAPGHFRDYISTPKPNNYRSLHTAVWGPNAQKLEIQIRTKEMHETAERGVAAHWRYKDPDLQSGAASVELGPGAEPGLRDPYDWLQSVVEMLDHGDDPEEFLEHAKLELFQDQVFCFTPKGRLIDLPRGATPLDFAYAVHTRVGDTCVGARVNGQHVPLRTRLRNGDMVEILRSSQGRLPENWASIVATGKARSAIRRLLRRSEQREHAKLGRELAEAAFEREGYQLTEKAIGEALAKLRLPDAAAVFDHVGRGALSVEELLDAVYPGRERIDATGPVAPQRKACIGPEGTIGAVAPDLFMMGLGPGERAAMAPCCCPVPGDRIVGVLGEDGEVAVHTIDCEALARSDPPQDLWRDLRWRMEECARINAIGRLVLTVRNEPGVLGAVTGLFAGYDANIANVRFTDREVDFFEIAVDLEVADDRRLAQIMAGLRAAEEVISVERPRDRPEEGRAP